MGGTSVAAPIVTGAIALLLTQSPNLTLTEIKNLLRVTSDNLIGDRINNNTGRLNIYRLLLANNPTLINQIIPTQTIISEPILPQPLNERIMNPNEKKFLLFQAVLINNIRTTLEQRLQNLGILNISGLIERLLNNTSPEVLLRNHIKSTESLLWLYRDAASMYASIDNPGNCPDGYYVCTLNGQASCCKSGQQLLVQPSADDMDAQALLRDNETQDEEEEPLSITDSLKNNVFLYWNCDISIYHTINPNMESKKVQVEEIFLRPGSDIKILNLNDIDNVNVDNIQTIHFGAPYDIFINL